MLLTGADREQALAVAGEIAAALAAPDAAEYDDQLAQDASAGRGASGVAVFLAEYARVTGDEQYAEVALRYLDVALERAAEERPSGALYGGTLGVGWALTYLEGKLLDPDDGPSDVDELACELVDRAPWPSFDLIRGLVGAGVYLLERLPRQQARDGLVRTVERLAEIAVRQDGGLTWWTDPATVLPERAAQYPNGYYDIGLAHGQAGVVALLGALDMAGVKGARELLVPATQWLRGQRLDGGFPAFAADTEEARPSRVAWCYGDGGVAIGLLAAATALDDPALREEVRDIAVQAALRTDSGVVDAGLCHGSAGLLLVFGRLAAATGDEQLAEAARYWFRDLVARRHPGMPFGGIPRQEVDEDVYTTTFKAGLLEGASGAGLGLLYAASDTDSAWDSFLLTAPASRWSG